MPLSPQPIEAIERPERRAAPRASVEAPAPRAAAGVAVPTVRSAGWYPDPRGRYEVRYWDGTRWTFHVGALSIPSASASDSESGRGLEALMQSTASGPNGTGSRWRTRLLIAGLAFLAVTGWGFGLMKAKAAADAPPAATPTSTTATDQGR